MEDQCVLTKLFDKWHPGGIEEDTEVCTLDAECDGYPLRKCEKSVATIMVFLK